MIIERAGFGNQDVDIVQLSIGNVHECGDMATQVQQGTEFDRRLGLAKRGPGKQVQTQVNVGGVKGIDRVVNVKAVGFVDMQASGRMDKTLGKIRIDSPVPNPVGVGQRISRNAMGDTHVIKLQRLCAQTGFKITQAFTISELSEGHTAVFFGAPECLDLVFPIIARHAPTERMP